MLMKFYCSEKKNLFAYDIFPEYEKTQMSLLSLLFKYKLSLSRPHLSQITAYLKVKISSLTKHENLTTGEKYNMYCGKEEKLLNFSSFPQYFQYISNFKSPISYKFVKCG